MANKKLFFDGTPLTNKHLSGVGQVVLETLRALDTEEYASRYDVFIFVPLGEAILLERFAFKHIRTKTLPYPHKFLSLFSRLRFAPPLDLFLGSGMYIFGNFRNWNLLRSKSVTYIHDVSFKAYPEFVQPQNLTYLQKYIKTWLRRADVLVTVSQSAKAEIEQELGVKDVRVVPNAVNTALFYPRSDEEVLSVRNKWELPESYHVFIGNIEPRKNLVTMIQAFWTYVKKFGRDETLVIVGGSGWRNEEIFAAMDQAREDGVSIIHPNSFVPDEDLPAIISGAKTLMQLSWHEGFGLPVLQALACGTPVLASDIPVLHEATGKNDARVVFVDPSDVGAMTDAIERASKLGHVKDPANIATWQESIKQLTQLVDDL